jgi:hypothetical protein
MTDSPEYIEAKALALKAGGSGDHYLKSTDRWYAVAVNSRTEECIILGWYNGEIKRQSPIVALELSMGLWRQLIHPDQGVACASFM